MRPTSLQLQQFNKPPKTYQVLLGKFTTPVQATKDGIPLSCYCRAIKEQVLSSLLLLIIPSTERILLKDANSVWMLLQPSQLSDESERERHICPCECDRDGRQGATMPGIQFTSSSVFSLFFRMGKLNYIRGKASGAPRRLGSASYITPPAPRRSFNTRGSLISAPTSKLKVGRPLS
ncbi:hypothetical protein J6590_011714 [Homalodisca vitripennis]|nr:hypothetical protein J6590_011714 [Homalodisca vitripennis]